jgi:hypothetical protein
MSVPHHLHDFFARYYPVMPYYYPVTNHRNPAAAFYYSIHAFFLGKIQQKQTLYNTPRANPFFCAKFE